jgi:regulatory protein
LSVRSSSSEELRLRLRRRAARPPDVDAAMMRLKDLGYLDDWRFAESFAANRMDNHQFGRMRILSDLRARRVPGKVADIAVDRAFEGKNETELIQAFIERRLPLIAAGRGLEDERKLAAAYRKLRRAGFSSAGILSTLKRFASRADLLEEAPPEDAESDESGGIC